jgi:hypothetical protein
MQSPINKQEYARVEVEPIDEGDEDYGEDEGEEGDMEIYFDEDGKAYELNSDGEEEYFEKDDDGYFDYDEEGGKYYLDIEEPEEYSEEEEEEEEEEEVEEEHAGFKNKELGLQFGLASKNIVNWRKKVEQNRPPDLRHKCLKLPAAALVYGGAALVVVILVHLSMTRYAHWNSIADGMMWVVFLGMPFAVGYGLEHMVFGLLAHQYIILVLVYAFAVASLVMLSNGHPRGANLGGLIALGVLGPLCVAGWNYLGSLADRGTETEHLRLTQAASTVFCLLVLAPAAIALPFWFGGADEQGSMYLVDLCVCLGMLILIWIQVHSKVFTSMGMVGMSVMLLTVCMGVFTLIFVLYHNLPAAYGLHDTLLFLMAGAPVFLVVGVWFATSPLDNSGKFVVAFLCTVGPIACLLPGLNYMHNELNVTATASLAELPGGLPRLVTGAKLLASALTLGTLGWYTLAVIRRTESDRAFSRATALCCVLVFIPIGVFLPLGLNSRSIPDGALTGAVGMSPTASNNVLKVLNVLTSVNPNLLLAATLFGFAFSANRVFKEHDYNLVRIFGKIFDDMPLVAFGRWLAHFVFMFSMALLLLAYWGYAGRDVTRRAMRPLIAFLLVFLPIAYAYGSAGGRREHPNMRLLWLFPVVSLSCACALGAAVDLERKGDARADMLPEGTKLMLVCGMILPMGGGLFWAAIWGAKRAIRSFGTTIDPEKVMALMTGLCCLCLLLPFGVGLPIFIATDHIASGTTLYLDGFVAIATLILMTVVTLVVVVKEMALNKLQAEAAAKKGVKRIQEMMHDDRIKIEIDVARTLWDRFYDTNEETVRGELMGKRVFDWVEVADDVRGPKAEGKEDKGGKELLTKIMDMEGLDGEMEEVEVPVKNYYMEFLLRDAIARDEDEGNMCTYVDCTEIGWHSLVAGGKISEEYCVTCALKSARTRDLQQRKRARDRAGLVSAAAAERNAKLSAALTAAHDKLKATSHAAEGMIKEGYAEGDKEVQAVVLKQACEELHKAVEMHYENMSLVEAVECAGLLATDHQLPKSSQLIKYHAQLARVLGQMGVINAAYDPDPATLGAETRRLFEEALLNAQVTAVRTAADPPSLRDGLFGGWVDGLKELQLVWERVAIWPFAFCPSVTQFSDLMILTVARTHPPRTTWTCGRTWRRPSCWWALARGCCRTTAPPPTRTSRH